MVAKTVPVGEHALIQRINRALAKEGEKLKKARTVRVSTSVGDFFIVDLQRNVVAYPDVDLEDLGRELKVLKPYEHFAD
jgi:hypothetical protein